MRAEAVYGGPLRLAAVMQDRDNSVALRALCDAMPGLRLSLLQGSLPEALTHLAPEPAPHAILFEAATQDLEGTRDTVATLNAAFPGVPLMAACRGAKLSDVRPLMRLGLHDLIPQPIEAGDLLTALQDLRQVAGARPGARPGGRVVAFLKAGGGSGATALAVQSAVILAARRAHQAESEVCLLDLDLQFGTAALSLDLDDRVGLGDLLEARERFDGALLRSVMGHHDSGLDILAAPRVLLPLDALTGGFVTDALALARAEYRTAVLDLPSAWTGWSHAALSQCDLIVLVAQLGLASVRRARRQLDALSEHGLGGVPTRLVLNRRSWGARGRQREAERALGRPFDFTVAEDAAAFNEALDRGVPLVTVARRSRVHRDLRRLADGLALALAQEPAAQRAPNAPGVPRTMGRHIAAGEVP